MGVLPAERVLEKSFSLVWGHCFPIFQFFCLLPLNILGRIFNLSFEIFCVIVTFLISKGYCCSCILFLRGSHVFLKIAMVYIYIFFA